MLTNADITIVNRKRVDRDEVLLKTVIRNVAWHTAKSASSGNISENADTLKLRIPIDADFGGKTYVDSIAFENMTMEEAEKCWTLAPSDIVVRGEVTAEKVTQTELVKSNQQVFLITDFSDNRDLGSDAVKHWRVGGS